MSDRKTYITVLNVFSCLSVLFLHTGGFWEFSKTRGWVAANLVESVFYFAVPVFIMIPGVTLMNYRKRCTTAEYFKRRIKKTVIPFLFWSIIGLFFVIWRDGRNSISLKPLDIINSVANCKYIGIYYFFIVIFGIYLSIPVVSGIGEESRKKVFSYAIITAFTVNSLLPFTAVLSGGRIIHNGEFSFYAVSGYLIYVFIGYYLDNYEIGKTGRCLVYVFGLLGLLVHFFGTWYLSYRDNGIVTLLKGYVSVPCVLYSSSVFLAFRQIPFNKFPKRLLRAITYFSGQTFGIYLIHIPLMTVAERVFDISPQRFLSRILFAIVLFIVSGFIIKLLQKIPIIKHIVP